MPSGAQSGEAGARAPASKSKSTVASATSHGRGVRAQLARRAHLESCSARLGRAGVAQSQQDVSAATGTHSCDAVAAGAVRGPQGKSAGAGTSSYMFLGGDPRLRRETAGTHTCGAGTPRCHSTPRRAAHPVLRP